MLVEEGPLYAVLFSEGFVTCADGFSSATV